RRSGVGMGTPRRRKTSRPAQPLRALLAASARNRRSAMPLGAPERLRDNRQGCRGGSSMRHGRRLVHAAALLLTLAACSMKNVEAEAPDAGETRTFDAPYAAVRRAAVIGIERMRLDITNQSE